MSVLVGAIVWVGVGENVAVGEGVLLRIVVGVGTDINPQQSEMA